MLDKTGRTLEPGQVVDIPLDGMYAGYVMDVKEGGLAGPDGRVSRPTLVITVGIPMQMNPGEAAPVYIIRDSDRPADEKSKVVEFNPEGRVH